MFLCCVFLVLYFCCTLCHLIADNVIGYYRITYVKLRLLCLSCLVANQQTVVELIGFFQRAFPRSPSVKSAQERHIDQSEPLVNEVRY